MLSAAGCGHKAKVQPPKVSRGSTPSKPSPPPPRAASTKSSPPPPQAKIEEAKPTTQPAGVAAPVPPPTPASSTLSAGPPIRIGLDTSAREARISSPGEFYLLEKRPEAIRLQVQGEMQVRVERGENSVVRYRVQVASFSKRGTAERFREKLAGEISMPAEIHENQALGRFQVRAGEFASREEAETFAAGKLRRAGYRDHLIVREDVTEEKGDLTLALRGADNLFRVNDSGFLFFPGSSTVPLRLNGKPYRGFLELSLNKNGRITVVNQLGVEEYLLGVVPAEMSPDSYPETAALEAQSIAARTYALKNTGRFRSEGYDLTADIRSQVYAGYSGEKDATNDAVRRTFGLAIYYQDQLIEAMYSSTCGGRTEDFANVFDAPPVPYLKGVLCAVEAGSERELRTELKGTHDLTRPLYSDEGTVANRALELAGLLGLKGSEPLTESYLAGSASSSELQSWIARALRAAGRNPGVAPPPTGDDLGLRASFIRYVAESFFGTNEIERRISSADADYYLANLADGDGVPRPSRRAIAYLMQQNLWRTDPENRVRPNEPIRRLDALLLLERCVEFVQPQILRRGVFVAQENGAKEEAAGIAVRSANKTQKLPVSDDVRLFLLGKGTSTPSDSLQMIGNERLLFHLTSTGSIDFLEAELNPTGASSDRYSPAATWDVTIARSALAEKLRPLSGNLGEFHDLKPWKLGTSGRAVQIQVLGSRRSVVLNGYRVRNALGLKDTLFTISRSLAADGSIESFTFHGRGWGHGVGLCQVGAYGMARAGKSYEEILKTYYQGVEIRKAY